MKNSRFLAVLVTVLIAVLMTGPAYAAESDTVDFSGKIYNGP